MIETALTLKLDFHKKTVAKKDNNPILSFDNLLPAVVQEKSSKEVLLLAYLNQEALAKSIETKILTLWSTSRNELWVKGATSGNRFHITKILVNCEQNSLLISVRKSKLGICHTLDSSRKNRKSCFYREIDLQKPTELRFTSP